MGFEIKITDNSAKVIEQMIKNKNAFLNASGQQIVSFAKQEITAAGRIDTGRLRNSLTYVTSAHAGESIRYKTNKEGTVLVDRPVTVTINDEDKVIAGSAVQYAVYHEYGTGIYASQPGGRRKAWKYYIRDRATGEYKAVWTRGLKPIHFLKRGVERYQKQAKALLARYMLGKY